MLSHQLYDASDFESHLEWLLKIAISFLLHSIPKWFNFSQEDVKKKKNVRFGSTFNDWRKETFAMFFSAFRILKKKLRKYFTATECVGMPQHDKNWKQNSMWSLNWRNDDKKASFLKFYALTINFLLFNE